MKNYKTIQEVRDCKELSAIEKVKIEYYEDMYCLSDALANHADVEVFEGSAIDYATDLFNKIFGLYDFSDSVAPYIDYKAFCNDLVLGHDIYQFNDQYLITNANYI